jgi:hypothetical protein
MHQNIIFLKKIFFTLAHQNDKKNKKKFKQKKNHLKKNII